MSRQIQLTLGERSYLIEVGSGLFSGSHAAFANLSEVALVVDSHVVALPWFSVCEEAIRSKATKYIRCVVPAGEESKNMGQLTALLSEMAKVGFSRRSSVIAFGGGVIGDLAGFLAASYLRGVRLIQIPTTLLAMVDSSVGGKTGVNLPEGKNLVGAFYQPETVVIDTKFLETLPAREFSAGMAEVIKYGLIRDAELFNQIEAGKKLDLVELVTRCVQIKADIVSNDERETKGLRALLNFGHTIGHAIEQSLGYGEWLHGEAVAAGMVGASRLSEKVFGFSASDTERLKKVLLQQKLPVSIPKISREKLLSAIGRDKKSTGKKIKWVLLSKIGDSGLSDDVTPEMINAVLDSLEA